MIGKAEAAHTTTRVTKAFLKYDMLEEEAVSRRIGLSIKIERSGSADCFANPSVSKHEASSTSRRTYSDSSDEVEQEPVLQGRTEKDMKVKEGGKRIIPNMVKASSCSYTPLSPRKSIFLDFFHLNIGTFRRGERIP